MITTVFSSRRAERFARLLDEAAGARRHHVRASADSDLTELVAMSQQVSVLPLAVEVDPEFRTGLRASLMARIEREGIGATATEPEIDEASRRRFTDLLPGSRTRGAIIVTVAASAFGAFGVSAASGDAVPGDTLYGIKRQTERAQLAFAGSDVNRGQLNFEFAKVRLAEAGALGGDLSRLEPVLGDMDSRTRDGSRLLTTAAVERGDIAGLTAVQQFVGQQRPTLRNLVNRLDGPAKVRAGESLTLLDKIKQRATGLERTVKCPEANVPVDALGAVPVFCAQAGPPQQAVTPGGPAGEATPQPALPPVGPEPVVEPAGVAPSVEAGSSGTPSAPATPADSGESADGVAGTIESVLDRMFGG